MNGQPVAGFGFNERTLPLSSRRQLVAVLRDSVLHLPAAAVRDSPLRPQQLADLVWETMRLVQDRRYLAAGSYIDETVRPALSPIADSHRPHLLQIRQSRASKRGFRNWDGWRGRTFTSSFGRRKARSSGSPNLHPRLFELNVDVIAVIGAVTVRAAHQATTNIPIVFAIVVEPIGDHMASDLERPGGNVSGVTTFDPGQARMQLQFLKAVKPDLERLAILSDLGVSECMSNSNTGRAGPGAQTAGHSRQGAITRLFPGFSNHAMRWRRSSF